MPARVDSWLAPWGAGISARGAKASFSGLTASLKFCRVSPLWNFPESRAKARSPEPTSVCTHKCFSVCRPLTKRCFSAGWEGSPGLSSHRSSVSVLSSHVLRGIESVRQSPREPFFLSLTLSILPEVVSREAWPSRWEMGKKWRRSVDGSDREKY